MWYINTNPIYRLGDAFHSAARLVCCVHMGCGGSRQSDAVVTMVQRRGSETDAFGVTATCKSGDRELLPFLPLPVTRHLSSRRFLSRDNGNAVFLFADISGFTALSERLSRSESGGADRLSLLISAFLTRMLHQMHKHGGHVVAFDGDALLVLAHGPQPKRPRRDGRVEAQRDVWRVVRRPFSTLFLQRQSTLHCKPRRLRQQHR